MSLFNIQNNNHSQHCGHNKYMYMNLNSRFILNLQKIQVQLFDTRSNDIMIIV